MNGEKESFLKLCLKGKAKLSELNDYVERWHEGNNGDMSLQRFLGLTDKEYEAWGKMEMIYSKNSSPPEKKEGNHIFNVNKTLFNIKNDKSKKRNNISKI